MTTNDEDWVPTEEEVRHFARAWLTESDFDRFLARVRRDALTALADHWDETVSGHAGRPLFSASGAHVRHYRDAHYPEETP